MSGFVGVGLSPRGVSLQAGFDLDAPPPGFGGNLYDDWIASLQTASWRGQPFGVIDSGIRRGRRVAIHEYPWRDPVWVEDLGREARRINFRGFLIGDDVARQEASMCALAEVPGSGQLVHPTLGAVTASLVTFAAGQRREMGRVVELEFEFVETADAVLYPTGALATRDVVRRAADDANDAIRADFFDTAFATIQRGTYAVAAVAATAKGFVNTGVAVVNDPRRAARSVTGLSGLVVNTFTLGRYAGGRLPTPLPASVVASVSGEISNVGRLAVGTAGLLSAALVADGAVQRAAQTMAYEASAL